MSRWRRFWRVVRGAFEPPIQRVPRSWVRCPICDRRLVGPYPTGLILSMMGGAGPASDKPMRGELIAKCPVHGKRPYNDPDARPQLRQLAYDEDPYEVYGDETEG